MRYAAHHATMAAAADEKGFTQRAHLKALVRRGAATPAQEAYLAGPPFPEPLAYLWGWHGELARTRTYGMNGPDPLTYPALAAWARLTGQWPTPEEVDALLQLDAVARAPEHAAAKVLADD